MSWTKKYAPAGPAGHADALIGKVEIIPVVTSTVSNCCARNPLQPPCEPGPGRTSRMLSGNQL